eukprot:363519-Chlamydomonas_euryale.AAC.5
MDGWMYRWMDVQVDGWVHFYVPAFGYIHVCVWKSQGHGHSHRCVDARFGCNGMVAPGTCSYADRAPEVGGRSLRLAQVPRQKNAFASRVASVTRRVMATAKQTAYAPKGEWTNT